MIIADALHAGMDYQDVVTEPLTLILDIVATHQITREGYRREFDGQDAEDDFMRVMSAR